MKNHTKMTLIALAALTLTACGKDRFNGTYTGFEQSSTGVSQVTLTLKEEKGSVTGSYTATPLGAMSGQTQTISGQLTASAQKSDTLNNVTLVITGAAAQVNNNANTGTAPNGYYNYTNSYGAMTGTLFTGSLTSSNDGKQLNGTLSQSMGMNPYGNQYNQAYGGNSKQLNLTKSGK